MRKQTVITAIALTFVVSSGAFAKQIYKWTDEDGNVHYGDVPVGESSERMAITSKPTDPARIQAQAQARADARAQAAEEAANAPAGPTPEELQAAADEKARKCSEYRADLQRMLTSRRLYREDEAGEREYLDEVEMQAARDRVEGEVEEYCSS